MSDSSETSEERFIGYFLEVPLTNVLKQEIQCY